MYNRVPKAGSSSMCALVRYLAVQNNFSYWIDADYFPDDDALEEKIRTLEFGGVFLNHQFFYKVQQNVLSFTVVREPLAKAQSAFYYGVSEARGSKGVEALAERERDPLCGCAHMDFTDCIVLRDQNNCTKKSNSRSQTQSHFFCTNAEVRDDECTLQVAKSRLYHGYAAVGVIEHVDYTLKLFEKVFPRWFKGALYTYHHIPSSSLHATNAKERLAGCISYEAQRILKAYPGYPLERDLYLAAEAHFWKQVVLHDLITEEEDDEEEEKVAH
ncbi:hypothetical protein CTAYLR_006934 [Chrysophaeum taylorii]|uniref:Uncharacterized protein n=1 Tax=Chrysophaeum taylorii TaxID=2483200 RepID=A0AAD7UAZ4_9STRA|nr:hypothetical protein CTAYLR_006934 [Chrysophaeum taylorii]